MNRPATLHDIARRAGVSLTTVTRALHGKPDISEETRNRVRGLARELGYQPNMLARALRLQKSKVIGVIIADISNPYFARLVKGVEETARREGYTVILCNTNDQGEVEKESLSTLLELRIAGLLAVPVDVHHYEGIWVPLVFLARRAGTQVEPHRFNYVVNDDAKGGYLATSHLIQRGYRRIAFVNGPRHFSAAVGHLEGYRRALEEASIPFDPSLVVPGNLTMEDGYRASKRLLSKEHIPMAVFCYSDYVATGVVRAVKEAGLKMPNEVGVVGYDDIDIVSLLDVPLSTVSQPINSIGARATEILVELIKHPEKSNETQELVLEPRLVIRASSLLS